MEIDTIVKQIRVLKIIVGICGLIRIVWLLLVIIRFYYDYVQNDWLGLYTLIEIGSIFYLIVFIVVGLIILKADFTAVLAQLGLFCLDSLVTLLLIITGGIFWQIEIWTSILRVIYHLIAIIAAVELFLKGRLLSIECKKNAPIPMQKSEVAITPDLRPAGPKWYKNSSFYGIVLIILSFFLWRVHSDFYRTTNELLYRGLLIVLSLFFAVIALVLAVLSRKKKVQISTGVLILALIMCFLCILDIILLYV